MNNKFSIKLIRTVKWASVLIIILFIVVKQLQQQNIVVYYPLAFASFFGFAAVEALVCNKISINGFVVIKTESKLSYLSIIAFLVLASVMFVIKFVRSIIAL